MVGGGGRVGAYLELGRAELINRSKSWCYSGYGDVWQLSQAAAFSHCPLGWIWWVCHKSFVFCVKINFFFFCFPFCWSSGDTWPSGVCFVYVNMPCTDPPLERSEMFTEAVFKLGICAAQFHSSAGNYKRYSNQKNNKNKCCKRCTLTSTLQFIRPGPPPGPLAQLCKVCKESRDKSCAEDDQLLVISAPLHVGPTASGEAALF